LVFLSGVHTLTVGTINSAETLKACTMLTMNSITTLMTSHNTEDHYTMLR
jgi:hypothetical protein